MAGKSVKKRNTKSKSKLSGEWIRSFTYILLAAACVAFFLIFGRSGRSIPTANDVEYSASPAVPSPIPKGVPMGKFIRALENSGMSCEFGELELQENGSFACSITLPDEREGARLIMETDSIGRVNECTLELPYMYAGEPNSSFSEITSSVIKAEYRKREKADKELIDAYLESIYSQLAGDLKIGTIDMRKIADSIDTAYLSQKSYDKKAGGARFYCETDMEKAEDFFFTFRLIAAFDYSK